MNLKYKRMVKVQMRSTIREAINTAMIIKNDKLEAQKYQKSQA